MALFIGNWKMNGLRGSLNEAKKIGAQAEKVAGEDDQLVICPPATLLMVFTEVLRGTPVLTGGQDCHPETSGPHTGRISAEMLADSGATYCIVGHSECRAELGDNQAVLSQKLTATLRAGMVPIFCVGESIEVRESGRAEHFVGEQLKVLNGVAERLIVAYEPIWAIGTGHTPSTDDISIMHAMMRDRLGDRTPLLYGGSVNPTNAAEILAVNNVDGALIGGASLKAEDFLAIAKAG